MRLYIHDGSDLHGHHDDGDAVAAIRKLSTVELAIGDLAGLHSGFARLVREGKTFRRVLWMTHGFPGKLDLERVTGSPPTP
jgi:hypothetical protein